MKKAISIALCLALVAGLGFAQVKLTIWTQEGSCQGRRQFATLTLPPLGVCVLKQGEGSRG
jgi:hypothetical protein